jgi:hypothetical protein
VYKQAVAKALTVIGAMVALAAGAAPAASAQSLQMSAPSLQINVLSTRADLVSGGQALTSIDLPAGTDPSTVSVSLNGSDVTSQFAERPNGLFEGLVTGLVNGPNTLRASAPRARSSSIRLVNHPIGGPIFSGPQIQPWVCESGATDAQCDQPPTITYQYMSSLPNQGYQPYDPSNPPPSQEIATTTTDNGTTVPYIVRVETGYLDRDQYSFAMLWRPGEPWQPWAPQPQWDHKLVLTFGCCAGADHTTGTVYQPLWDPALSRGMAVMSTAMANSGHDASVLTEAESLIMAKEHLINEFGTLQYTIGYGCSGGSLAMQQVDNAYPGLMQGIIPQCSFPDFWSTGQQLIDYQLLEDYWENPVGWGTGITWNPVQIGAVEGHPNPGNGLALSTVYFALFNPAWDCPGVTAAQLWSPSNPTGVRCDLEDYMINLFGPYQGKNPYGYAGLPVDNVGVQYGLQALERGIITPEQFIDLNQKIGGYDNNVNKIAARMQAQEPALASANPGGAINETSNLTGVPIIDIRGPDAGYIHDAYRSWTVRARLQAAEGHFPKNDVIWFGEEPEYGDNGEPGPALVDMESWLSAVEADKRDVPLAQKVADDRPASVHDECSDIPNLDQVVVPGVGEVCQSPVLQTRFATPRMVAGQSIATDLAKCQLKPLSESDYYPITFSDQEWSELQQIFPNGVCDFSKAGVDQQPTIPWQTYQNSTGSVVYGGKPLGPAPANSGSGWASPSFDSWLSP